MRWKRWLGIGLIGLSGVWFAAMILVPFTSLSLEIKAALVFVFLILMEVSFWLGTLIVGKQVISKFWKRFKRKSISKDDTAYQTIIKVTDGESGDVHQSQIASGHGLESKAFVIFMENLPYGVMIFLGMMIFLFGLEFTGLAWGLAAAYALYAIIGAMWIIIFVCPYCHNFGDECFSGHGQVSAKLMKKKDEGRFVEEFKRNIPVIIPIYILPVIFGAAMLIIAFSWVVLTLIILFALNSFILSPRISMRYACSRCSVRKECPWMGEGSMFSKGSASKKN